MTQQNTRLVGDLSLARLYLSPAELQAAQSSTRVAPMAYGNVLERMTAEQIGNQPMLGSFLNATGVRGRGPDILGMGPAAGQIFDITTPGQIAPHLARAYGQGLIIVTYQRPLGFTAFPP